MRKNIFDKLSFLSLFLTVVLLPIFCLPFTDIPVEAGKGLLLVLGLILSIIFWAIARLSDGKVPLPRSPILVSGFGLALVLLLSALLSGDMSVSLFGAMFDVGSFWFIFSGFVLMLMCSIIFKTARQAKIVLLGMVLSAALLLVFQALRLFMPAYLSLGILSDKTANVLGSWNAFGLFAGFAGLIFLLVLEFFPVSKMARIFLRIFLLLSILLAAAVNFPLVWALLVILSLIIFVYKISIVSGAEEGEAGKRNFPATSFLVVIIALLFFLSSGFVGSFIPNRLNITSAEISPSFGATLSVARGVLAKHPVFGIGPNKFGAAWSMYKSTAINGTQFWDTYFSSGSGLLPTFFATSGAVGILGWLIFFALFLTTGAKSLFSSAKNNVNLEMVALFILASYLFVASFFYFVGSAIFLLAFAFTGIFIGLSSANLNREASFSFLNDHRKSFFSILGLVLVVIFSVTLSFKYLESLTSFAYFNKALSAPSETAAENFISQALSLHQNDLYLRTYSQVYMLKLNSITGKSSPLSDPDKADLQASFDQAVNGAQMAVAYDRQDYLNFELLGSIYQTAGALGVKDAYGQSVAAYQGASSLNPLNPGLKLAIANVFFADGKIQDAKDYANQALSLKPDYVDALLALSQIAKSEGDNAAALSYAQSALSLDPANQNLQQYVNSLANPAAPSPLKK